MRGDAWTEIDDETLIAVLRAEIRRATGCTEVAAAALVAAHAVRTLGRPAEHLQLSVSPNVYKNGVHVAVPGTPFRGLAPAAAIGAAIGDPAAGLEILDAADAAIVEAAGLAVAAGAVRVGFTAEQEPLLLRAAAQAGNDVAVAVIAGAHDRLVEVRRNDELIYKALPAQDHDDPGLPDLRTVPMARMLAAVDRIPVADLEFLMDAARLNADAARAGRAAEGPLGRALDARAAAAPSPRAAAQSWTGAASEARMGGLPVPVAAITGSGNHGIANFLGVWGYARAVDAPHDRTVRALAIASLVTVAIKAHTGKLTAFCGCAIAPATGLAAAAAYLMGGDAAAQTAAMQTVIGTFAGMLCDGAKASCAFKVAAVVGAAIDIAELAVSGAHVAAGDGIVGATVDESFANLGRLNDPGMRGTERAVLEIIAAGAA